MPADTHGHLRTACAAQRRSDRSSTTRDRCLGVKESGTSQYSSKVQQPIRLDRTGRHLTIPVKGVSNRIGLHGR
jgi:hypothetical protein